MKTIVEDQELLKVTKEVLAYLKTAEQDDRRTFYIHFVPVKGKVKGNNAKDFVQGLLNFAKFGNVKGPFDGIEPFCW